MEILATRAQSFNTVKTMKKLGAEDKDLRVQVNVDKVYVNQQLVTPKVKTPTAEQILNLAEEEKEKAKKLPRGLSNIISETSIRANFCKYTVCENVGIIDL